MDNTQRYLINHPHEAKFYADLWDHLLEEFPHAHKFQREEWDDFLEHNHQRVSRVIRNHPTVGKADVSEVLHNLWEYGALAHSTPVQEAIQTFIKENPPKKTAEQKVENEKKDERIVSFTYQGNTSEDTLPVADDTREEPQPTILPQEQTTQTPQQHGAITREQATERIKAASAEAPLSRQEQVAQTIQKAINQAPQEPVIETLTTAQVTSRPSRDEQITERIEQSKSPQPEKSDFISTKGKPLIQKSSTPPTNSTIITPPTDPISANPPEGSELDDEPIIRQIQEDGTGIVTNDNARITSAYESSNNRRNIRISSSHPVLPSAQQEQDTGDGYNEPPRPPRRDSNNHLPRIPGGRNGLSNLIGNSAKATRLAALFAPGTPGFWGLVIAGIILIIIILVILIIAILSRASDDTASSVNVTITKTGPTEVPNPTSQDVTKSDPSDILYDIKVTWSGGPNSIIVTDKIPDNTEFVSAENGGTYNATTRTVTWNLSGSGSTSSTETPTPTPTGQGSQVRVLDTIISPSLQQSLRGVTQKASAPIAKRIIQEVHASSVDFTTYTQTPYYLPAPSGPSDITFSEETIANANTLGSAVASNQSYLQTKFDAKYVDPFLSVLWTVAIEGTGADPYAWNCMEGPGSINQGCDGGFWSGGWQVGYGVQVSQAAPHLADDFNAAYGPGSADDADKTQQVGQGVIDRSANSSSGKITNPSSFPHKSASQLASEAIGGSVAAQQAVAILLMDPKLGSITVALEVAGDIASRDNWRTTMESWPGSYYSSNMQNFSNRGKALADVYTGIGGSSGGLGLGSGSQSVSLTLRPKDSDSWVMNIVTANAIGGGGGSGNYAPSGTADAQCTPQGGISSNPEFDLNSKYNVRMEGYSSEGIKNAYDLLTCLSTSKFTTYLGGVTTTIHNAISPSLGSIGMDCDGNTCNIWIPESTNAFKFILTHEFGHVIYYTNSAEEMHVSEFENAWAKEGGLSPYSGPYYGGQGSCSTRGMVEDFAEMVAYYYNPTQGGKTGGCDSRDNPKNSLFEDDHFPLHLEVAKKVL